MQVKTGTQRGDDATGAASAGIMPLCFEVDQSILYNVRFASCLRTSLETNSQRQERGSPPRRQVTKDARRTVQIILLVLSLCLGDLVVNSLFSCRVVVKG